jgi:hypothetical protein
VRLLVLLRLLREICRVGLDCEDEIVNSEVLYELEEVLGRFSIVPVLDNRIGMSCAIDELLIDLLTG